LESYRLSFEQVEEESGLNCANMNCNDVFGFCSMCYH